MAVAKTDQEHPNADLVRRAHAAFKSGDIEEAQRLFDWDSMVWTVTGNGPASGVTKGMDGVLANFGDIMRWTEDTYNAEPLDYLGSAGHAINISRVSATRPDGRRMDMTETVIFQVRDGKLATAHHMAFDEAAWDAFFA